MLIVLNFLRRALSYLRAEVDDIDIVGYLHNKLHVMFDQEHRQVVLFAYLADKLSKLQRLLRIHAGRRLVKKQKLRRNNGRHEQRKRLALAAGQGLGLTVQILGDVQNFRRLRFRALTEVIEFGGANVLLMMPQTYMNLSGEAVGEAARFYKIPADHVIVISDDISLPLGKLRVRGSGSAGGHNGLKNIIAHLGTDAFPRVKVGVGAPEHDIVDWVIGPFTANERKVIDGVLDRALGAAECIITDGVSAAQNRYNG